MMQIAKEEEEEFQSPRKMMTFSRRKTLPLPSSSTKHKKRRSSLKNLFDVVRGRSKSQSHAELVGKQKSRSEGCSRRSSFASIAISKSVYREESLAEFHADSSLQKRIQDIERNIKSLDAESYATDSRVLIIASQLDSGFDDIVKQIQQRKVQMMQELQDLADGETLRLNRQRERLRAQLAYMQMVWGMQHYVDYVHLVNSHDTTGGVWWVNEHSVYFSLLFLSVLLLTIVISSVSRTTYPLPLLSHLNRHWRMRIGSL